MAHQGFNKSFSDSKTLIFCHWCQIFVAGGGSGGDGSYGGYGDDGGCDGDGKGGVNSCIQEDITLKALLRRQHALNRLKTNEKIGRRRDFWRRYLGVLAFTGATQVLCIARESPLPNWKLG